MLRVDPGGGAQITRVVVVAEVVEAALERPVALAERRVGEIAGEPVVRPRDARRARPRRGLVALQPAQLGPDRLLGHAGAGAAQHLARVELGGELVDLGVRARVVVEQRRAQRLVVGVQQQHAGHAARHAEARRSHPARMPAAAQTRGISASAFASHAPASCSDQPGCGEAGWFGQRAGGERCRAADRARRP